jgi:hypothetical protein
VTQFRAKRFIGWTVAFGVAVSECAALDTKQHIEQQKVGEEPCLTYTVSNSTLAALQLINSTAELPDGTWI